MKVTRKKLQSRRPIADAVQPMTAHAAFDASRYVYVAQSDQVSDLVTQVRTSPQALARRIDGTQPSDFSAYQWLFSGPHAIEKVDAYGFFPNQPQIVEQNGARYLNQWKPRDFEPVSGDVTPFLAHLSYLYDANETLIAFVLNWIATLVQQPGEKQSTALLLTSEAEGIGKGVFAKMIAELVGSNNVRYLNSDALVTDFNDWLVSVILVIVEEFEDSGKRGGMSRIKNLITDEVVDVNPKHAARYRALNRANFIFFANATTPLKLTEADRRFVVHRSQAMPKPASYYRDLMVWFMKDGRAHVLDYLLQRDLGNHNPKGRAPETESHRELVIQSRAPHIDYLHHAFESQETPFACDLAVAKHVVDHINSVGRVRVSTRDVENFLREIGAINLGRQYPLGSGGRNRPWLIRNHEAWGDNFSADRVRDAYIHPDNQPAHLFALETQSRAQSVAQPTRKSASPVPPAAQQDGPNTSNF